MSADPRGLIIDEPLLSARDLTVRTKEGTTIVREAALEVAAGEAIGIVGESGSGKSMTAKAIIGLLPPGVEASGTAMLQGRSILGAPERELRRIRGREIGLVMQDPFTMLNPLLRCGRQVTDGMRSASGGRIGKKERREEATRRLVEVGIHDPTVVDRYPFELSGGMRQRVGIAAALSHDPDLLIADEPSTALDVTTQRRILGLLRALQSSRGMGLILITHDLRVATETCGRIYVMYAGSTLEIAESTALDAEPRHPYTLGLLSSEPPVDRRLAQLPVIDGGVPRPDEVATMCPFVQRCAWAEARCHEVRPTLSAVEEEDRWSACLRVDEIRSEMRESREVARAEASYRDREDARAPLVRVKGLSKRFGDPDAPQALGGVSIEIGPCESVGLVGESGSGKTTLGRCLMGLERPTSGEIEVCGIRADDFDSLSGKERREIRHQIQMIFQDPYSSLNPVRSIGATLREAVRARDPDVNGLDGEVERLLRQVGLPVDYGHRKPAALSGGERQRVAIARALAMKPKLIVCDEPVSALDVSVQAQVLNLLTELREEYEVSYLFITHDLAVVRQIAERVYVLHQGKVVEDGLSAAVLDSPQHAYTQELVSSVPGGASSPSRAN